MHRPLQGVTFDLWQTLMHDTTEQGQRRTELRAERIYQALCRAGRDVSRDEVEDACHAIWREWETAYWEKLVDPGFDAQIAWLRERFRVPADAHQLVGDIRAGYIEPIFAISPQLDSAALPVLTQLEARGLKLGLICNTSITPGFALRRLLARWGLDKLLTVQLFSDETGSRKPAPAMYRMAAEQLGVDVAALVHVGDRDEIDRAGAEAVGARGLKVGPEAPLSDLFVHLRQIE